MKINQSLLVQFISGIIGGTILVNTIYPLVLSYNLNYGCPVYMGSFLFFKGFSLCGNFSLMLIIIIGALLGILIIRRIKIKNYPLIYTGLILLTFVYVQLWFRMTFGGGAQFVALLASLAGMVAAVVPSAIITVIMDRKIIFKHRSHGNNKTKPKTN